jgi:hypothetical protein
MNHLRQAGPLAAAFAFQFASICLIATDMFKHGISAEAPWGCLDCAASVKHRGGIGSETKRCTVL